MKVASLKIHKRVSARAKENIKKSTFLVLPVALIFSTLWTPIGHGIETASFTEPKGTIDLTSLIGTYSQTLENQQERADPSDLYRAPGEPIINDPFKSEGVGRGFLSFASFSRFALMPSSIQSKQPIMNENFSDAFFYRANLPPCFGATQTDCIYDFSLITKNEKVLKAIPYSALPKVTDYPNVLWGLDSYGSGGGPFATFKGDKNQNLPSGGDLWIWNVPSLKPGKNSLYSASVALTSIRNPLDESRFANPETKLQISPVEVDLPICRLPRDRDSCAWRDYKTGLDGAIFESDEISIKRSANEFTGKYRLGFRVSVPWTSWLISTVSGVDIQASRQGSNYVYEISGQPSSIPTVRKWVPINENYWAALGKFVDTPQCQNRAADCSPVITLGKFNINDEAFETLEAAEGLLGNKASYMTKTWAVVSTSLSSYLNLKAEKTELQTCSEKFAADRPAGITASNATIFQHSPPTWDKNLKTFTYQVGSFKEAPDGSKFLGDYSLLVSADVARCLWGVEVGSAKAALQVLSSTGDKQVATTIVGSDSKWFRFRASGFHFSSPKIVASVTKATPAKTTTITCIKGKLVKKVSALKPVCPSGYKKK